MTLRALPAAATALCAGASFALAVPASAQTYPAKPLRMVIPFAPGGGSDFIGRIAAQQLTESLGQPVIVENRGGAGGSLGVEVGMKSPPDGYTLTLIAASYPVNPSLYKLNFDPIKDIQPVIQLSMGPFLVAVHPSLPVKTVKDLIALARKSPGDLNYATSGQGSIVHLATEHFASMAGIRMTHIPYKGTGPAMTDLLGGHVSMQFAGISSARSHVQAGKLRALAVTGRQRNPAMREVSTFDEVGLPGIEVDTFWGLYAPAAAPATAIATLNRAFAGAMKNPALADRLADQGFIPIANSPQEHTRQMREMIARWIDVIERAKIRVD